MGAHMGGFFDGADVVFVTFASSVASPRPAEAITLPTESVPIDEGTHTGKVSEAILVPIETLTLQEVATPVTTQGKALATSAIYLKRTSHN